MPLNYDAPDDVDTGGGNWLRDEGTFHLVVTETNENPQSKNGKMLEGFRVQFQVAAGTVKDNENKLVELLFFHPSLSSKDGGKFARQKQARFFLATGLMTEDQLGKTGIQIELGNATGRHVIATLEKDKDGKYLDLHYANIWHIDDPEAKDFPRSAENLKLVPAAHRRKPDSFTKPEAQQQQSSAPATAAATTAPDVSLDDL